MTFEQIYANQNIRNLIDATTNKQYWNTNLNSFMEFDDFYNMCLTDIFKQLKNFDESKSHINAYITTIIITRRNMEIRHLKSQKRDIGVTLQNRSLDYMTTENNELGDIIPSDFNIHEEYEKNNLHEVFNGSLNKITDKEQLKIIQLMLDGCSLREIGRILNIDYMRVRTQRERIKRIINKNM